ncbi:MAG: hypothetical protein WBQ18_21215 [Solirubrobacteraceae bacterium]|jgi:hypothetical protein
MNHHPDRHSIRRIVLPSGRTIEVVRFYADESTHPGLHVCPECESHLVQPVDWAEAPHGFWELTLQCPNCFWLEEGVFDQAQIDSLEEQLDDGVTTMLADLRRLAQANMTEDIERFAAALNADLILPEDF